MRIVLVGSEPHRSRIVAALRRYGIEANATDGGEPDAFVMLGRSKVLVLKEECGRHHVVTLALHRHTATHIARLLTTKIGPATLARSTVSPSNGPSMGANAHRIRVLAFLAYADLRLALRRALTTHARVNGLDVIVHPAQTHSQASALLDNAFDVLVVDDGVVDGLSFLAVARAHGVVAPAFVLTDRYCYEVEARATDLGARFVPKEGLDVPHLTSRILAMPRPEHVSSVRLKRVSAEDAAEYLAEAPGGVRSGYLVARKSAVLKVVAEQGGNRTTAAKILNMTRQQVQDVMREARVDAAETPQDEMRLKRRKFGI